MDIFEKATKVALRFQTPAGMLAVEDLWKINIEALDSIAVNLKHKLSAENTESFISTTRKPSHLQLRFDVAKYIIDARLEDAENSRKALERKQAKEKILEIIANKQDDALQNKSLEELQAMLED